MFLEKINVADSKTFFENSEIMLAIDNIDSCKNIIVNCKFSQNIFLKKLAYNLSRQSRVPVYETI